MDQTKLSYHLDFYARSSWLTVTATPSIRSSFVYVQELGDFHCGPDYYTRRENLPSYLIKLTVSGKGILEYADSSYMVTPGSFFWIDCRSPQHYYTSPETSRWHTLWVHLYGPTASSYYTLFMEQNSGSPVIAADSDDRSVEIFNSLMSLYGGEKSSTVQDDILASALLTQLMVNCINATVKQKSPGMRNPDYVTSIRDYLDANYQDNISLDSLAQAFSINKYYLQKLFKKHIGLSPNEYLTRIRLEKAKNLLRTTDDTMIQIAQEVGYTASYFDNVFKKYEGTNPHIYRQSWYDSETGSIPDKK